MTEFLLIAFTFLLAGVATVPIAARLGLGSVLGYLAAGIVIGPLLRLLGVELEAVQEFGEFGVVMMLFLVGLELEVSKLWSMRRQLLGLGGGQVLVCAGAIAAVALALGQDWRVALAVGMILSLSSTAIVLQTLNERGLARSDAGEASFAVLLFQDIAAIPMLALMPLLALPGLTGHTGAAAHGGPSLVEGLPGWQAAGITAAAVAAVVFLGNRLIDPIFRFITRARLQELFTAAALMLVVGIALLMTLVGLSPALGTFLAGVVLATSTWRHELEADIQPFKALLLGLFFMTVGAGIDLGLLWDTLGVTLALTLGLITVKAAMMYGLAKLARLRGAEPWLFALGLAQAGEFGFVLLALTVAQGVLPQMLADQLLLVVALSMLLTPGLFILYERVITPRHAPPERPADAIAEENGIIIAGNGRVGGVVNRMLRSAGLETTVIDYSSRQIEMLERFGFRTYFGDATREDLLRSAGIEKARLLIVAIDDKAQITAMVAHAIKTWPHLHVIARAVDRNHVYDLWWVGCRDIIRETYDSSLRMGRSAFEALGATHDQAEGVTAAFRAMDRATMVDAAEKYDPSIPIGENAAYIELVRELRSSRERELAEQVHAILRGSSVVPSAPPVQTQAPAAPRAEGEGPPLAEGSATPAT